MTEAEKILNTASEIYFSKGFHKIPVDDIATSLKMSKKTIYKHYPSKDDLIKAVVELFLHTHGRNITAIMSGDRNAVEKIFTMMSYFGKVILKINEKWFVDIQNHNPELWDRIEEFRFKMMNMNLKKVIDQGKKEEFIIDKSTPVILSIFLFSIRAIVNPSFLVTNKLHPGEALKTTIEIIMNGILTDKGKKYLKKLNMENK